MNFTNRTNTLHRLFRAAVLATYLMAVSGFAYPANCAEQAGGCCCHEAGDAAAAECCCCAIAAVKSSPGASDLQEAPAGPTISGSSAMCASAAPSGVFGMADRNRSIGHRNAQPAPASYNDPEFESQSAPVSLRAPPVHTPSIV